MSCQACCVFEPNSDYIWERHVLKLLADGWAVFSKIFNFLHYLPDGIGSNMSEMVLMYLYENKFL